MFRFGIYIGLILFLSSCTGGESTTGDSFSVLAQKAESDPTSENFAAYYSEVNNFLQNNKTKTSVVHPVLERAADFSLKHKRYSQAAGYLTPLVRTADDNGKYVLSLSKIMNTLNKEHAAKILYKSYKNNNPNGDNDSQMDAIISDVQDVDVYLDTIFNRVLQNPDEVGLNRNNALKFVDCAEAYALANRDSESSPERLYKASEVARSIQTLPKALSIYDWILEDYPNYEKAPTVLFLKGFIIENNVDNDSLAKSIYDQFLVTYPDHELASSVKFLIENLGKSDEEILDFIQQK